MVQVQSKVGFLSIGDSMGLLVAHVAVVIGSAVAAAWFAFSAVPCELINKHIGASAAVVETRVVRLHGIVDQALVTSDLI